jgi:glycine hydroxymethyltransferase
VRLAIQAHEQFRARSLNLQASENLLSPAARAALASDMASRYSLRLDREWDGVYFHNAYGGTLWMEEVEEEARAMAQEVFGARHALIEPVGGHAAAMVALLTATPKGGLVASTPQSAGGYTGYDAGYLPAMFGMKATDFPFDRRRWTIDIDRLEGFLRTSKPDTLLLGASYLVFPYDLPAIHDACDDADQHPVLLYDGSHVMGLIAGGAFQRPLAEGVQALYGSTHKSFFGPQGGLFLTNDDEVAQAARENITWRTMDNAHENRIAALAVALAEMAHFGRGYAHRVVSLSKELARALDEQGMPVRFRDRGYTESHQILLDDAKLKKKFKLDTPGLSAALERNSIIVDAVGRIGTAELARTGAMPDEMEDLAGLIVRAAKGKRVKAEVEEYRSMLPAPAFTFD